jgi:hypothetical protein
MEMMEGNLELAKQMATGLCLSLEMSSVVVLILVGELFSILGMENS